MKFQWGTSFTLTTPMLSIPQEKRSLFPRFYFIGDDDLLEILGQSTNPQVIQSHLKKMFAGIHSVQFDEGCKHITAMRSLDGELVPLTRSVRIQPEVEVSTAPNNQCVVRRPILVVVFTAPHSAVAKTKGALMFGALS